jgi:hypothetical protein
MKITLAYLGVVLAISTASATPLPQDRQTDSIFNDVEAVQPQVPSFGSKLGNVATATAGTAMLIGAGIGISEWALHWYNRLLANRNLRAQQNQTLQDDRHRRQQEFTRRERAMDLLLEMAENYSDDVASNANFDGNFEPLMVPPAVVGAVENVFEQTADVENMDGGESGVMESLENLKDALKPVMNFNKNGNKRLFPSKDLVKEKELVKDEETRS